MHRKTVGLTVALLAAAVLCGSAVAAPKVDQAALDNAFQELPKYDWGKSRAPLNVIDDAVIATHGKAAARRELEDRLAAVLKGDATRAAKQFVCRKLSVIATDRSVPALAPLLTSEELSHMARYALERMETPAASKALRDALGKVSGKLKVGVINSLGVREDKQVVSQLVGLLKDPDKQVAGAAAAALGRIGTMDAAKALADFRAKAPKELAGVAVDASLDAAQRLLRDGKKAEAGEIYDELNSPKQPPRVRKAAFQGLVAVRPTEAAPRLMKALSGEDKELRGLAVRLIRETPGSEATKAFASYLPKLQPDPQVALLGALEGRKDPVARPAVLAAVKHADAAVRVAALRALGAVGNVADVALLAATAAANKTGESDAARASLARLSGKDVNRKIISGLGAAAPEVRVELIRSLGARAATEAALPVTRYIQDPAADVRMAAVGALGVLGDERHAPPIVRFVRATKNSQERAAGQKALEGICSRAREKCAPALVSGMTGAGKEARVVLLNTLVRAGGAKALAAVVAATKDRDPDIKDAAIRALAAWSDAAAADPLLKIVQAEEKVTHKVLAFRGYIRLVRGMKLSAGRKVEMLTKAMSLAPQPNERKAVLAALGEIRSPAALRVVAPYVNEAALAEEASAAAVRIASAIQRDKKQADLIRSTMENVLKVARSGRTKRDAQRILQRVGR